MNVGCHDCGLSYNKKSGWCDIVLPNNIWKKISPDKNGNGLLCFTCIAKRCNRMKINNIPIFITSGPFILEIK